MKIAKYLILLLFLLAGTISVFVATKDGKYSVKRSKLIDLPKETVYKYVSDRKNWDSINPWIEKNIKLIDFQNPNDTTVTQKILLHEIENNLTLKIKDTLSKKTVLQWSTEGSLSFKDKFLSIISKGAKNNFDDKFDEGLNSVNTILTREIKSFNIKFEGFVRLDTIFYIQRPLVCKTDDLPKQIKSQLPKLKRLLANANVTAKGSPFIIYHKKDTLNDIITFSVALPTEKKVYTTSESDIFNGQTNPFGAVKATLTGNYINKKEALAKINEFIKQNKLEQSPTYKVIEFIPKNILTEKSASTWVTEIYVPVRPIKVVQVKKVNTANQDSITKSIVKDILNADKNKNN